MNALGWACTTLGLTLLVLAVWWTGFLSGRRYESGIWEKWLEQEEEAQEAIKVKRGVRLKTIRVRR